jgi:DNA-binding NarL/FixJ family response regulator
MPVLVIDDHQLLATTLSLALCRAGIDAKTVTPRPLPELFDAVVDQRPGLVLLDLDLGAHGDSTPLIAPLTDIGIRVVVLTGFDDRLRIAAALEQGAAGYRLKGDALDVLIDTVQRARTTSGPIDAQTYVLLTDELRRARRLRKQAVAPFERLTERERETLRALAAGWSVREIAEEWVVSEATMRSHVRSLLTKLGAHSQLAAVTMAIRTGWLDPVH